MTLVLLGNAAHITPFASLAEDYEATRQGS